MSSSSAIAVCLEQIHVGYLMSRQIILTVEDDAAIRRGVVDALGYSGYEVIQAGDGLTGLDLAVRCSYDLLLLDLVLPGCTGLDILSKVRETRPTQPVIILSAKGEEQDRVTGLKMGADDYVVKPFSIKELLARLEAVLRRTPQRPSDIDEVSLVAGVAADFNRCEIRFESGSRSELSEKEVDLLRYLVQHSGRVVAREELLENVWRINSRGLSTRTIDMHVARLREKLKDDPSAPRILLTVRGKGYMIASNQIVTRTV